MNVSGFTTSQTVYTYAVSTRSVSEKAAAEKDGLEQAASAANQAAEKNAEAAVYEPGVREEDGAVESAYKPNAQQIQHMKAELQSRMQSLVTKMLSRQITGGENSDIWSVLKSGKFTVDAETKAQAQKDIADDGYWGVEQTSERIVQFALALSGGDPDKLDTMIDAFQKGYAEAEKAMGGALPDVSQRTRDAVMDKFQNLKDKAAKGEPLTTAAQERAQKSQEDDAQKTRINTQSVAFQASVSVTKTTQTFFQMG